MSDLTPDELRRLTGATRPERQAAALVKLGIPFRAAGRAIYVAREVAQHWPQWQRTASAPNMAAVR